MSYYVIILNHIKIFTTSTSKKILEFLMRNHGNEKNSITLKVLKLFIYTYIKRLQSICTIKIFFIYILLLYRNRISIYMSYN